jgi:hypothetical protein
LPFVCVCVVVVVTGAGTVVCCDVVVVLSVAVGVDEQAHRDIRAAATAHGMMSLFMGLSVFGWLLTGL